MMTTSSACHESCARGLASKRRFKRSGARCDDAQSSVPGPCRRGGGVGPSVSCPGGRMFMTRALYAMTLVVAAWGRGESCGGFGRRPTLQLFCFQSNAVFIVPARQPDK